MLNNVILVFISMLIAGCATKSFYKEPTVPVVFKPVTEKKTLMVRFGSKLSSNVYFDPDSYQFTQQDEFHQKELKEIFEGTNLFSKVSYSNLNSGFVKKNDVAAIEKLLNESAFDPNSDFQLNLTTIGYAGHAYMLLPFMAWGIVHIGTLGLVPMWMSDEQEYEGDLRDRKGKILYSFNKKCSVSIWSWSPFLLSGKWRIGNDERKGFQENCIKSILSEAQSLLL